MEIEAYLVSKIVNGDVDDENDEPAWSAPMAPADYRGLTPLIYSHSNPYGPLNVDLERRLISR